MDTTVNTIRINKVFLQNNYIKFTSFMVKHLILPLLVFSCRTKRLLNNGLLPEQLPHAAVSSKPAFR